MSEGIAVIIASVRRPKELGRWVSHIERQTVRPLQTIWAVSCEDDLPEDYASLVAAAGIDVVFSPIGLTKQRNRGLAALNCDPELIAFFDDDYVPTESCLEDILDSFRAMPDVVGLSGNVLADGINTSGIPYDEAVEIVGAYEEMRRKSRTAPSFRPIEGLYGCNMILRAEAIEGVRFDENLPLYGWQEDVDFTIRAARGRKMGETDGFAGVHQGTKSGRTSGKRLGYSQVVNNAYLFRNGSMRGRRMMIMIVKNFLANHARSFKPEPWVDRRGRALGNWLGLRDVLMGRIDPNRVLDI